MFDTVPMGYSSELAEQARLLTPITLARERMLAVPDIFSDLLPNGGLQHGWTVRFDGGVSARALAWALLSEVTTAGRWIATVDVAGISLAAASELGVAIERVLVVEHVGAQRWSAVLGALIGSVDAIIFDAPQHRIRPSEYRKISSRCRERGTVLIELAGHALGQPQRSGSGQLQYDLSLWVEPTSWAGLGCGYGHLQSRSLKVSVSGRRAAGRSPEAIFELPASAGNLVRIDNTGAQRPHRQLSVVP